ncbi:hypothetical protein FMN63_16295 [Stappia sp. BW2]|jgi:hypothetical protein|uniref:hypothetical protein n=1 Tax=Stappia sp. BW2 TaxID=2592622 RepID=UPI0011DE801F|nr:hypothetical protein [Stappia sp. BW2]TYC67619.1 hypothetical protein FMN63_16295 [Stappia sp. BW2]
MNLVDEPPDQSQNRRSLAMRLHTSCPQGIQPRAQLDLVNLSGKLRKNPADLAENHQKLGELLQISPVEVNVN